MSTEPQKESAATGDHETQEREVLDLIERIGGATGEETEIVLQQHRIKSSVKGLHKLGMNSALAVIHEYLTDIGATWSIDVSRCA